MTKRKNPRSQSRNQIERSHLELLPFLWVALGWAILGVIGQFLIFGFQPNEHLWLLAIFLAACSDLWLMAELFRSLLEISAGLSSAPSTFQTLLLAMLKFLALGALGALVWLAKETSKFSLLWGLATVMIVPVLGGLWSHYRQAQTQVEP